MISPVGVTRFCSGMAQLRMARSERQMA